METVVELSAASDGASLIIHFTGGIHAWKIGTNLWDIGPISEGGVPVSKGSFSTEELQKFAGEKGLHAIAFEDCVMSSGVYYLVMREITKKNQNHLFASANEWRNIESNITQARLDDYLTEHAKTGRDELDQVLDAKTSIEAVTGYISDSLRSLDISVSAISDHYYEQLSLGIREGYDKDQRFETAGNIAMYAHVHAFFLQIGAARDYLAKLISIRTGFGESKDAINRLVDCLCVDRLPNDAILNYLVTNGNIVNKADTRRMIQAGWLEEVGEIRNQFVRKRPYGSLACGKNGFIDSTDHTLGLHRYSRLASLPNGENRDILDVVAYHYEQCNQFFIDIAKLTNMRREIRTITDKGIINIR